ncbi:MAG TPA: urease accessory protein UreD [Pseudonocardia sp.]|jgi:urease accessory protein|uniref:urease accessory protein UreD n=1 Tax=Pseudonocardia sp. TaxID=60912 RepID=UPI002B4B62D2|nr:urease accessory protein UreD [Pseudonocardia sp.]HLU58790.1 urease accessory protein UreD [Pseudonocardia sp.]
MRATARVVVERGADGRSVVRELRSQAPLALLPQRGAAATASPVATVHLVGSATSPLGGDDVLLDVEVGPGADLVLTGVAATLALPGQAGRPSRLVVRLTVGDGGGLQFLPEPTVVTQRADHRGELHAELGEGARLRCREVLVAGRSGEPSGRFHGLVRVTDGARPLLVQEQELGDHGLMASAAHLAGRRVLGTEVLVWGEDPAAAVAGEWWSLTPLAGRGGLATAVGDDAISTQRALAEAVAAHPGWSAGVLGSTAAVR